MKKSKILTLVLCTALLSAATVLGTLAYLTSRESVVNTFTVGQVKIELDEAKTDADGNPIYNQDGCPEAAGCVVERTKEGNNYHVVPGESYLKDPMVTVKANSEEAYVRMILTVHNASAVQAIIDADENIVDYAGLFAGWNPEIWLYEGFEHDEAANTIAFEFRYKDTVKGFEQDAKLETLFEKLVVPGTVTNEQLEALYNGNFKIVIEGHAIQAATFENAEAAWLAFDAQYSSANQ